MVVRFKLSALRQSQPYEYVIRYVLGGFVTVFAGIVADICGPGAGGLMLAFPAIFCASATLVEKHERQRKADKGLRGDARGRQAAALDASGAAWGSVGLAAFGAAIWMLVGSGLMLALIAASFAWCIIPAAMWHVRRAT